VVDKVNNEALPVNGWPARDEYANRRGAAGWELVGTEGVSQFFKRARPGAEPGAAAPAVPPPAAR
jgi:hypothetical protein